MAPKNPRGPSLVPTQISTQSDVEDNELCRWKFSNLQPSFVDFVRNEVTQDHLEEYRTYFKIPRDIDLILPVAYSDPPDLSEDEKRRIAKAVQTKMETRRFGSLVTEQKLQEYGLIPKLGSVSSHLRSIDPICGYLVKRARASEKNPTPDGLGEVIAIDTPKGPKKRKRKVANVVASSRMGKAKAPRALIEIPPSRKDFGASWISKCTKSLAPATHTQESSSLTPGTNQESERTDDVRVQQDFSNINKNQPIFDDTTVIEFPSMAKESTVEAVGSSQVMGMAQVSTQVHPIDIDFSTSAAIVNLFSPGSQMFAPPDNLQSFGQMTLTEQAKTSAYFSSMLIQRCEQVTRERDDLSGRLSIMTIEKDQVLTDNRKLQVELSQTKDDLRVALEERDKASKAFEAAQTKIAILEEQLKEYTENLKQVRKEVEIRAVDLFKQSPAFDAFLHNDFAEGVIKCRDFLRNRGDDVIATVVNDSLVHTLRSAEKHLEGQVEEWKRDRIRKGLEVLPMHIDLTANPRKVYGTPRPGSPWLDPIEDLGPDPADDSGEDNEAEDTEDSEDDGEEEEEEEDG
ncbi:hypothetical protein Q3G72_010383 [Acer saccharum]|nr:hypothetical protein Q3G72_010383 [Acer saccharum]